MASPGQDILDLLKHTINASSELTLNNNNNNDNNNNDNNNNDNNDSNNNNNDNNNNDNNFSLL